MNGCFYERLNNDPLRQYHSKVKAALDDMILKNELPPLAKNLITTPETSCFYLLWKIYKPDNPESPLMIVSTLNCPTENIAAFLDEAVLSLVANLTTYVNNTTHALKILNTFDFNNLSPDQLMLNASFNNNPYYRQVDGGSHWW